MRRRSLLLAAAALPLAARSPRAAPRAVAEAGPRRLRLRHAASGAVFSGPWHNGHGPDPVAMAELSAVLADTRTGTVRPFDPDAVEIVWRLGRTQRIEAFTVLSGYRTPETNRAVHGAGDSQHMQAAAMDLLIPATGLAAFAAAARGLGLGGVGLYADRGFVHVDSGPVRHWGDATAPAAPAVAAAPRRSAEEERLDRMAEAWAATRRR